MPRNFLNDFRMNWGQSIAKLNGKPVYIHAIKAGNDMAYLDLETGDNKREIVKPNNLQHFDIRLGFVNIMGWAVYVQRIPARKYKVGIYNGNCKFKVAGIEKLRVANHKDIALMAVTNLKCKELVHMLNNEYPSIKEAYEIAYRPNIGGSCAFDKQFAVSSNRDIVYRNKIVGSIIAPYDSVDCIVFDEGYEGLREMIGDAYVSKRSA